MREDHQIWESLQDVDVPEKVHQKLEYTLESLPSHPHKKLHWVGWVACLVLSVSLGMAFLAANPTLAANIPIIGGIFASVETKVSFSGNYSAKAEKLEPDVDAIQTDSGLTLRASEVYCNGYSIFVTLEVKSFRPIFEDLQQIISQYPYSAAQNDSSQYKTAHYLYMNYTWSINGMPEARENFETVQGTAIDKYTFIGMLKVDFGTELEALLAENQSLSLNFIKLGYDKTGDSDDTMEEPFHAVEGNWTFALPFTVDQSAAKLVPVHETNENGFGIEKILVSPYQIVVYTIAPYTVQTEADLSTKEDIALKFGDREYSTAELDAAYEEYKKDVLGKKDYEYFSVILFNGKGERVARQNNNGNSPLICVFAVQGMEIQKLDIYMATEMSRLTRCFDTKSAEENAVFHTQIDLS